MVYIDPMTEWEYTWELTKDGERLLCMMLEYLETDIREMAAMTSKQFKRDIYIQERDIIFEVIQEGEYTTLRKEILNRVRERYKSNIIVDWQCGNIS